VIETQERASTPERPRARPAWLGWIAPVVLAIAPWAWFAVRDASPGMDAVEVALPLAGAVLAVLAFGFAIVSMQMRHALISLSLVAFTVVVVVSPRVARSAPPPLDAFRLVAVNTYDDNLQPRATVRTLVGTDADVLVVVETTTRVADGLSSALPTMRWAHLGDLNVFARWPLGAPQEIAGVPATSAVRVQVDRPGSPFVVYAIHLANPLHEVSFSQHAATVERLLRAAQGERLPVALAGDFNMTDRSTSYRALDGALRDAMRASLAGSTYERGLWALLQLRIDHVFVSRDLCSANAFTFGVPGSDHEGLDVQVGVCA
jgi:endonuclease/exonuclease/phosphatase (EEP) superfamily protein YafD